MRCPLFEAAASKFDAPPRISKSAREQVSNSISLLARSLVDLRNYVLRVRGHRAVGINLRNC